jgi:tyrosyl-tRNA synthetase
MSSVGASLAAFRRGAVDVIDERDLVRKLERVAEKSGGLRVKLGLDPSSPDLHFGHAVLLTKLADLQALGHTIVLIVGDATAMVGDPSGRNKLRPQLTRAEVNANLVTYKDQAGLLLDMARVEVRHNSEWFDAMRFEDVLRLLGRRTVAQTLAREDFQKRMASDAPIGLHELVYPVMQGWDSVMVKADVELGGTDQLFNLLVGRDLQAQEGQEPQVVLTTPLINGLDGRKMSKSYGNAIGLTDAPQDVFGKTMSIVDEAMPAWFELLTRLSETERVELLTGHPRAAKARLAWELVARVHGPAAADAAREAFDRLFVSRERPNESDIPVLRWPSELLVGTEGEAVPSTMPFAVLLKGLGLTASSSEARRLITQGGVRLNDKLMTDPNAAIEPPGPAGHLIQIGKRRFARVATT